MAEISADEAYATALELQKAGRLAEAEAACRDVLPLFPRDVRLLNLLAILDLQQGMAADSIDWLEQSLKVYADQPQTLSNYAIALEQCGRVEEALAAADRAVALRPDYAQAHANRANFLSALDRPLEALDACNRALACGANFVAAYANRGNALRTLLRYDEALADYDIAVQMAPGSAVVHNNRGNILKDLGRHEDALEEFSRALALDPTFADAYTCRGNALRDMRRYEEAIADHDRALAMNPEYASAKWNKALVSLLIGDFENGWQLFEARWQGSTLRRYTRDFSYQPWRGEADLKGKSILIYAEQGLGDTVQFCRYIPMLNALGAKVIFEVQPALKTLISTLPGDFALYAKGEDLPKADYVCPLMSLPLAFKTRLETIPGKTPYLSADPEKVQAWSEILGEKTRPRIGLAWSGKAGQAPDLKRSMAAAYLAPMMALPLDFHCLQKEIRPEDVKAVANWPVTTHAEGFGDFSDTAALISLMDLVIAVDTSVAHVAGALGKPVWLMLPWANEWRWLTGRTDSPWYPGMTLIRQPARDDWDDVVAAITMGLKTI